MSKETHRGPAQSREATNEPAQGNRMITVYPGSVEMSSEIGDLMAALALAQGQMSDAAKDSANDYTGYKYASLSAVRAATLPALNKHGLSLMQLPVDSAPGEIGIVTILGHNSGQYIKSIVTVVADEQKGRTGIQARGSSITYMRRYAWCSVCGIATEDDDGAGAGTQPERSNAPIEAPRKSPTRTNPKKQETKKKAGNGESNHSDKWQQLNRTLHGKYSHGVIHEHAIAIGRTSAGKLTEPEMEKLLEHLDNPPASCSICNSSPDDGEDVFDNSAQDPAARWETLAQQVADNAGDYGKLWDKIRAGNTRLEFVSLDDLLNWPEPSEMLSELERLVRAKSE